MKIDFGPLPGANGEFSPDGRRVAVTQGRRVRVMDVASGDWLGPPVLARINTISYAPDGSTFATGGTDGAVSLWDGNTGSLLGTVVPGAFEPDLWAHFLPDGHTVLIATLGGDVYTWDTRPEHWSISPARSWGETSRPRNGTRSSTIARIARRARIIDSRA